MFSIIIPSFNNVEYLKLCLKSIKKNSKFSHEIIVFVNEGKDGTLNFLESEKIKFLHSNKNIGLCAAVNKAADLATNEYILYSHDDMYFCPGWDIVFVEEVEKYGKSKDFFLSGTMIQPFESFINLDCGKNIDDFDEVKLLKQYRNIDYPDYQGSTWAPHLIPTSTWKKIGGFSEEYTFGIGSDPDLNMKLWKLGVRLHKGLGNSRVYHFGSISLRKKVWNDGHKVFLLKWGITTKFFKKFYLKSDTKFEKELEEPLRNFEFLYHLFICKLKYIYLKLTYKMKN